MADKLMYIPNDNTKITPSVSYNLRFKHVDTQFNKSTNQNSLKSPKLLSQQISKRYYRTLGTSIKKQPIVPPLSLSLL